MHRVLDSPQPNLIGRADHLAALHSAASHPDGEAIRIVIPAMAVAAAVGAAIGSRRAAEFAAPDYQRALQQSARFQVGEQSRNGVVYLAGLLADLKSRGLLESTLVVWGGEF